MSMRTIGAIIVAIVCGGAVAIYVTMMSARAPEVVVEMDSLVVAGRDIARGTSISEKDIAVVQRPKGTAHKASIIDPADALERVALSQFLEGEAILEPKLAPKKGGRGLAALVTDGMRAVTIQVSRATSNVAGFILPGNKVDVLLNLRGSADDGTGGGSTTTLLQAIDVLACGQQTEAPEGNKMDAQGSSSVTLMVTPAQAAELDLAQAVGSLSLALRNLGDTVASETPLATMDNIRFRQGKPAVVKPDVVEAVAVATVDEEPEERWISTLRGNSRGRVMLYGNR
ncbi:MAG: Flp pilus assembly protein CpaB [Planctomycetota bacterium]|nr:Flp pilus assembly protein CpaB [Planctomycetota bacterium]